MRFHTIMSGSPRPAASLLITLLAILGALPSAAQQLPNPGFEEGMSTDISSWFEKQWPKYTPWSSGTAYETGRSPRSWSVSSISKTGLTSGDGVEVAERVDYNGKYAVKVTNTANNKLVFKVAPGYFSLGKTWATSKNNQEGTNDFGTHGGFSFLYRPDALVFSYKLEGENPTASVIAYTWTGDFKQEHVPGNITVEYKSWGQTKLDDPTTTTMENRDRNVLGIKGGLGDNELTTQGTLIAHATAKISEAQSDWTDYTLPLKYESDDTPAMINVIFAAFSDYFNSKLGSEDILAGNSLTVANPHLLYYSKLKTIKINGAELEGFGPDNYTYEVDELPAGVISYEIIGAAANAEVTSDDEKIVITVTNKDGADENNESSHTYTINKKKTSTVDPNPENPEIPDLPNETLTQLPNPEFSVWSDCEPWTSNGNTDSKGKQPKDWKISHVIGIPLLGQNMGATEVGESVEGIDGGNAIKVYNSPNSMLSTQTVPGYFTLGTPWSTSVNGNENDGGTFGGRKFAYRPDGLQFSYKRSGTKTSPATVVAYTWKGTFTQKDVPGNIVLSGGNPTPFDMDNRDRNILGMETAKGGDVTTSEGTTRIAVINQKINDTPSEWKTTTLPFTYETEIKESVMNKEVVPEMINVIFAANDYFDPNNIEQGNSFTVAQPRLVYWSKLSDIAINGQSIEDFDPDRLEYSLSSLPEVDDVTVTVKGMAAKAVIEKIEDENGEQKIVITVTNYEGKDENGVRSHIYTLTTDAEASAEEIGTADGWLTVTDADNNSTTVKTSVSFAKTAKGQINMAIEDLVINHMHLGKIKLNYASANEDNGRYTFAQSSKPVSAMNGSIKATVEIESGSYVDFSVSPATAQLNLGITVDGWGTDGDAKVVFTTTEPDNNGDNGDDEPEEPAKVTVTKYPGVLSFTVPVNPYDSENTETAKYDLQVMVTVTETEEPDAQGHSTVSVAFPALKFHRQYYSDLWGRSGEEGEEGVDFYHVYDYAPFTLTDVSATTGGGATVYSREYGPVDVTLADGTEARYDVGLSGSATAEGVARMALTLGIIDAYNGEQIRGSYSNAGELTGDVYEGKLTIDLAGTPLTEGDGQDATVNIIPDETGTSATFILPNFTLESLGMSLGDIRVDDVTVTTQDGGFRDYTGSVSGMELMGGAIVADVDLSGTVSPDGEADMTINVTWEGMPIAVHFTGKLSSSTSGIAAPAAPEASADAKAEWFTITGVRVADGRNLAPGIYIERRGGKSRKVLVR